MIEDMIDLGRRAVACKYWRWMPGMLRHDGYRYVGSGVWVRWSETADLLSALHIPDQFPDLSDPATLGCLLALVRAAYRDTSKLWEGHVEVRRDHRILFFVVSFRHDASGALVEDTLATGSTEAEALVCALKAAAGTSP